MPHSPAVSLTSASSTPSMSRWRCAALNPLWPLLNALLLLLLTTPFKTIEYCSLAEKLSYLNRKMFLFACRQLSSLPTSKHIWCRKITDSSASPKYEKVVVSAQENRVLLLRERSLYR